MPTTPRGFRYPAAADTPNVPRDLLNLATDLDNLYREDASRPAAGIKGRIYRHPTRNILSLDTGAAWVDYHPEPPVVSSLPSTPYDGQRIYYQNASMALQGVIWHMRRLGGAWVFLGGPPLAISFADFTGVSNLPTGRIGSATVTVSQLPVGNYDISWSGYVALASGTTAVQPQIRIGVEAIGIRTIDMGTAIAAGVGWSWPFSWMQRHCGLSAAPTQWRTVLYEPSTSGVNWAVSAMGMRITPSVIQ